MKNIIKIASILFAICLFNRCGCDDEKYFSVVGIDAYVKGDSYYYDKIDSVPIYYKDDLTISISYVGQFYSTNSPWSFSLIKSAHATAPCHGDGYAGCNELITKINILSSGKFDSIHNANDTVNSLFSIWGWNLYQSIEIDSDTVNLLQFVNYKIVDYYDRIWLSLDASPTIDSIQEFTIEMHMSNNEVYTAKTGKVKIR